MKEIVFYKSIKLFALILLAWFVIHTSYIIFDGLKDNGRSADVAIVLGNKINNDGTLSERLKQRLNQCLTLYSQHRVKMIIVSGGLGKEGFWEAEKMKDYLVANHVAPQKILVDNYGDNTEKTVINSIHIMDSSQLKSAISVSQYFHQTRTKKLYKIHGFQNIESSSPHYFEIRDIYGIFREFVAYYKEVF